METTSNTSPEFDNLVNTITSANISAEIKIEILNALSTYIASR